MNSRSNPDFLVWSINVNHPWALITSGPNSGGRSTRLGLQRDWLYELAVVADGATPRREGPSLKATGLEHKGQWLAEKLRLGLPTFCARRVAIALGSFGVYIPKMAESLTLILFDTLPIQQARDEAVVYLSFLPEKVAGPPLLKAISTPIVDGDDFLQDRSLFGILLLDDVETLTSALLGCAGAVGLSKRAGRCETFREDVGCGGSI